MVSLSVAPATHQLAQFSWGWAGNGATEWWFDAEAVCLDGSDKDYVSGSGLTASATRIVAFRRSVKVTSFRGDIHSSDFVRPGAGEIAAEFVNGPGGYRACWTGTAVAFWSGPGGAMVGDDLDRMIELMLGSGGQMPTIVTCRHQPAVEAAVVVQDEARLPYFLCKACRLQGVRWEEFTRRNREDVCPYFRRAAKAVCEKSDPLPAWMEWKGDNLLATYRRAVGPEGKEAFEVVYLRKNDGFVRRAVLVTDSLNERAWMSRYNGFISPKWAEFEVKYPAEAGRVIWEKSQNESRW